MKSQLEDRIRERQARVAVIGLGYVGLPLAVALGQAGFTVFGYDCNQAKVALLAGGESPVGDVAAAHVAELVSNGRLLPTADPEVLGQAEVVIICVPTPLTKRKQPDLGHMLTAVREIVVRLRPGMLVILESTTYPGTTDEVLRPLLEEGGLRAGEDFFLAFSPERIDPANTKFIFSNTPRVVGGINEISGRLAAALYEQVTPQVHLVSNPAVAEMAKLLENTFRHVNIALVNEMAILCRAMGIDIWEVVEAAATKPFGFMPFYPGPGVGGHCIPIDPQYFSWKVRQYDHHARFIELAAEINDRMPYRVANLISDALNDQGKPLRGANILVIGVAYKKDVTDARESPALKVIEILLKKGARVSYHDPFVPMVLNGTFECKSVTLTDDVLLTSDCVVILTNHSGLDYANMARLSRLIVDTRNSLKGHKGDNIVRI